MLLTNAWRAADELAAQGISAAVIDLPWLNRIDDEWVREALGAFKHIVTLDNHYLEFGQGVMVGAALARTGVRAELSQIGLTEIPACGIERRRARVSRARCRRRLRATVRAPGTAASARGTQVPTPRRLALDRCIPNSFRTGSPTPRCASKDGARSRSGVPSTIA